MRIAEHGVRYLLINDAAVAALVETRIHPQRAPQGGTLPYQVFRRINADHQRHMAAASGTVEVIVQLDIVSESWETAKSIANANREALDGYLGTLSISGEDLVVQEISLIREGPDVYVQPSTADDVGKHVIRQDYRVWHEESIPTFA